MKISEKVSFVGREQIRFAGKYLTTKEIANSAFFDVSNRVRLHGEQVINQVSAVLHTQYRMIFE